MTIAIFSTGSIWVEWDNGYVNVYHYNEMGICSIRKVLEPRDMSSDISSGFIRTGYRVVRGKRGIKRHFIDCTHYDIIYFTYNIKCYQVKNNI